MRCKSLLLCIFCLLLTSAAGTAAPGNRIVLASGTPSGTYHPLGESLASLINMSAEDLWVTTLATEGSVENCRLIAEGRAESGFVMGSVLAEALAGTGPFREQGPLPVEAVARLFPAPQHLITPRSSGIDNLGDLRGHRVSHGLPGSGNRQVTQAILRAAVINPQRDIFPFPLPQDGASRALAAGTVDAAFFNIAVPAAPVLETCAFRPVRLVPLPPRVIRRVVNAVPGTSPIVIPAGTYPGQDRDIPTVASDNYLVVRAGQDPDLSFLLARSVLENTKELSRVLKTMEDLDPAAAFPASFPIAPGALRYFTGQGVAPRE